MNQGEIRRCKIHRRINVLRNRYDRRILGSMTVLITGLTICMGILLQMAHVSGIPTVNDGYVTGMDLFSCGMEQMFM